MFYSLTCCTRAQRCTWGTTPTWRTSIPISVCGFPDRDSAIQMAPGCCARKIGLPTMAASCSLSSATCSAVEHSPPAKHQVKRYRKLGHQAVRADFCSGAIARTAMASTGFAQTYRDFVRQPLKADECSLVVIDIQEKLLPPIVQKERLVKNVQLLI